MKEKITVSSAYRRRGIDWPFNLGGWPFTDSKDYAVSKKRGGANTNPCLTTLWIGILLVYLPFEVYLSWYIVAACSFFKRNSRHRSIPKFNRLFNRFSLGIESEALFKLIKSTFFKPNFVYFSAKIDKVRQWSKVDLFLKISICSGSIVVLDWTQSKRLHSRCLVYYSPKIDKSVIVWNFSGKSASSFL